jgi:hypothetical protein
VATLKIPVTSPRVLQPNRLYSYDVSIATSGGTSTLNSLGLLSSGQVFGRELVPLGYQDSYLPSFALPPADITQLRVLFGSCRRVACGHIDSMPWIDDLMADGAAYSFTDPLKRPHQMFLCGDQIYADDVFPVHLHFLMDLGKELIGTVAGGGPIERVTVDNIRRKVTPAPTAFNQYGPSEKRFPAARGSHLAARRAPISAHHSRWADEHRGRLGAPVLARRVCGDVPDGVERYLLAAHDRDHRASARPADRRTTDAGPACLARSDSDIPRRAAGLQGGARFRLAGQGETAVAVPELRRVPGPTEGG